MQVWPKPNPWQLYNASDKIQGIRSDWVSEELWTKVPNILQEVVILNHPQEKEIQKGKVVV